VKSTSGFVKLDEHSIGEHTSCTLGKYLEEIKRSNPSHELIVKVYEPHKKVHILSKEVIRLVNSGNRSNIDNYLRELDVATEKLLLD
jgi:methyl-accepting chemotaxis protein